MSSSSSVTYKKSPPTKHKHSGDTPHPVAHHHRNVDDYSQVMAREKPCTNPFASFSPKPLHTHFESQSQHEHVVLLLRRHPFTNLRWILVTILLLVGPVLLQYFPLLTFFPARFQFVTMIGWYLVVFGYILENFLSWFFQVNIITDERIVDIDFYSLIYKRVSSAKIDNIEDVTSSTGGFTRSIFNFGNVIVQTAGVQQEFEFTDIPQPDKVIELLNELQLEEEQEKLEGRAY